MRKIKFRLWDNKRKEWLHDTAHAVNLLGETILLGGLLQRQDDSFVSLKDLNDIVVMQFTGLKDKAGLEIYEGDILKAGDNLWKVYWSDVEGCFNKSWIQHPKICGMGGLERCEVIGNIYLNPELIEVSNGKP